MNVCMKVRAGECNTLNSVGVSRCVLPNKNARFMFHLRRIPKHGYNGKVTMHVTNITLETNCTFTMFNAAVWKGESQVINLILTLAGSCIS